MLSFSLIKIEKSCK